MNFGNLLDAPIPAEVTTPSSAPTDTVNADLLEGLDALADLLKNTSDTLNHGVMTIEDQLNALSGIQEEWVLIRGTRASVEPVTAAEAVTVTEGAGHASQEYVFGGVAVTILRLAEPTPDQVVPEGNEHEDWLGCSKVGDRWVLVVRTGRKRTVNSDANGVPHPLSELQPLVDAPLEVRVEGVRRIPTLVNLIESRCAASGGAPTIADPS